MNTGSLLGKMNRRQMDGKRILPVLSVWAGLFVLMVWPQTVRAVTVMVTAGGDYSLMFSPASVDVHVGDTVEWTFGSPGHTTTSGVPGQPTGLWDSGVVQAGGTFSHTFTTAGTFSYFCSTHGACCNMIGSITVSYPPPPTPTPTPSATPSQTTFANISTRGEVQTGDDILIGGFIVTGTQSKEVLVRAIGPSLSGLGVTGALSDPTLELHTTSNGSDVVLAVNDNWMDATNAQQITATTLAPGNPLESAILMTLQPGSYTVVLRGANNATGVALVEVYDLSLAADAILANISTRGLVELGDDIMIAGVIVVGPAPRSVLLRGIGPSLPISGALVDPVLELHDKNGALIATNDDWRSDQEAEIMATMIQPGNDAESAILATLTPDSYTAILRGKNNGTGVALVEAYELGN